MNEFNIGKNICEMRKAAGLTQEALAAKLGLSYQAVSKWENGLSCPDLALIPAIAEIFGTDINSLFGFSSPAASVHAVPGLPWEDDDTLYIALFQGHRLMEDYSAELKERLEKPIVIHGEAKNINCAMNLRLYGGVEGDASAGGNLTADGIGGSVTAGGNVTCDAIGGDAKAGGSITCDNIGGDAEAGGSISCDSIGGNAHAGFVISDDDGDFHGMKGSFVLDFDDMDPTQQEKCRKIKEKADELSKNAENFAEQIINKVSRLFDVE